MKALRRLLCRLRGHDWNTVEAKRFCRRCGREEWIFSRPYPRIGQAKYYWKHMPFDTLKF